MDASGRFGHRISYGLGTATTFAVEAAEGSGEAFDIRRLPPGVGLIIYGEEADSGLSGREFQSAVAGQEVSGQVKGRQPVASASGRQQAVISGREP